MPLKKDIRKLWPGAWEKVREAQRLIARAVEGGLLDGLKSAYVSKYGWCVRTNEEAQEACRRFRSLVPEGVRVLWTEGEDAAKATLSIEVEGGRLTARVEAVRGSMKFAEG